MDKELVKYFIQEVKEQRFLKKLFESTVIPFEKYFKNSGKVEPPKLEVDKKYLGGIPIYKISQHEDMIVDYYYRNSNSTLQKISEDLDVSLVIVKKALNKHFDNLKLKKNDNNNEK